MNNTLTLVGMLTGEKTARREHLRDVPDSVGSKPFIFSIGGETWHATNRKGADWKQILKKSKDFTGDLHQQFADLKEWLESDWRGFWIVLAQLWDGFGMASRWFWYGFGMVL